MRRRGLALLVVLAALVLTIAGAAAIARHASTLALSRRVDAHVQAADDLAFAAEDAVLHWLVTASDEVVLGPAVFMPSVVIRDDAWHSAGLEHRVRIAAWDEYAMAPISQLTRGSPLRGGVPDSVLRVVDRLPEPDERFGLEQVATELPVFPAQDRPAIGSILATHNPPLTPDRLRRRSPRSRAMRINVNTAPLPMLEAAMRAAGYVSIDHIVEARAKGRSAVIGPGRGLLGDEIDRALVPVPVDRSDCWAVRVDASVGLAERSWWTVWVREADEWTLAQRILIREGNPNRPSSRLGTP
jgi:hypothetical protein